MLIKNHHLQKIIQTILQEKEKASKKYFESLIKRENLRSSQEANTTASSSSSPNQKSITPIEEVFYKHMKRSVMSYEDYFQELKKRYEATRAKTQEQYATKMSAIHKQLELELRKAENPRLKNQTEQQIQQLTKECDQKLQELDSLFSSTSSRLLAAYDSHLKDFVPLPWETSVQVSVLVPSKQYAFEDVTLRPEDSVRVVRDILKSKFEALANPVIEFSSNTLFFLAGPFEDFNSPNLSLLDENRPVSQLKMLPGSKLVLRGDIKLKSDGPKKCFRLIFVKDTNQKEDFYACKTCKTNWICKECSKTCHQGHDIADHIKGHAPTWACCYCFKTKACRLQK